MEPSSCRVFISYAHDNEEHKEFVHQYSDSLIEHGGLDCWIDRYVEDASPKEGWPHWMRTQIHEAKYVLVVCSPIYLARYERQPEEEGKGLGAKFEAILILNDIYQNETVNEKFIPVLARTEDKKCIPDILQSFTYYDLTQEKDKESLYRRITNQPKIVRPVPSKIIIFENAPPIASIPEEGITISLHTISSLPELTHFSDMKPGTKILQAFFALPVLKRFQIAQSMGLVENGESVNMSNGDKLSAKFLERAYNKGLMSDLWSKLFNESIDPNPFKK